MEDLDQLSESGSRFSRFMSLIVCPGTLIVPAGIMCI